MTVYPEVGPNPDYLSIIREIAKKPNLEKLTQLCLLWCEHDPHNPLPAEHPLVKAILDTPLADGKLLIPFPQYRADKWIMVSHL